MTITDIARVIEATNGVLTQDVLRAHTGSYQVLQQWLSAHGFAIKAAKGQRRYWVLAHPLAETLAALRALPEETVTRHTVKRAPKGADDRAVFHRMAKHWQVVYDPNDLISKTGRFGSSDLKMDNGEPAPWLTPGLTLRHDVTGAELCFYEGRLQKL